MSKEDEKYMDEFDKYNIEQDKYAHGKSGKPGRSKTETEQNKMHGEHTRKIAEQLINSAHKSEKEQGHQHHKK